MNGRPDLNHLVKSIEREAATLPEDARKTIQWRVGIIIEHAALKLVDIRDYANELTSLVAAKGGDDE